MARLQAGQEARRPDGKVLPQDLAHQWVVRLHLKQAPRKGRHRQCQTSLEWHPLARTHRSPANTQIRTTNARLQ
jgi:hypothetical protein